MLLKDRIRDLEQERDLADRIPGLKFDSPVWTADSRGLVYYRYLRVGEEDGVDRDSTVFYHALGTPVDRDLTLIRSDPADIGATTFPQVSHDGRFVILFDSFSQQQRLGVLDVGDPLAPRFDGKIVWLSADRDGRTSYLGHIGDTHYLRTTVGAPKYRIAAVTLADPHNWQTVVPESEHLLQHAKLIGGHIVTAYRHDVRSEIKVFRLDGTRLRNISLPAMGSAFYFSGSPNDPEFTFAFDSYAHPLTLFRHDLRTDKTQRLGIRDTGHNPADYLTQQVFFASRDGTKVPMFITHRADLELDGNTPTLLYGYGAAGSVEAPIFWDEWFAWLEAGGLLAVANIRGGGEYGEAWREAGRLGKKQNTYDDFIAAAETLIREGYTSPSNLAINGFSNGGLLIGAVMTQRPELFAAALPYVGVMDALRFPSFTAGPRWAASHGDPADPEAFKWLRAWSPLHRIVDGTCYPATLVATAANDDLVHPSQSYKFAARLQAAQGCDEPVFLRIYPKGAHKFIDSDLEAKADLLAFAAHFTGLQVER